MIEEFNDLPWHDAELKEITVNKVEKDLISIQIIWPEAINEESISIEFFDCFGFITDIHLGFSSPNYIDSAICNESSIELEELRKNWKRMGANLNDVFEFKIETITTGSRIIIFAKGYKIIQL